MSGGSRWAVVGTAVPYGTYDLQRNQGLVNVGVTHETAEFAVESIRRWWQQREPQPGLEVLPPGTGRPPAAARRGLVELCLARLAE